MSIAVLFQQHGQLADAEDVYRADARAGRRTIADALHFSGVLAHQQGRSDEALRADRAEPASSTPDQADWHSNLGIVLQGAAAGSTRRSRRTGARSRSNPGHANAHSNLGVLLRAHGQLAEAEAAYRDGDRAQPGPRRRVPQPRRRCSAVAERTQGGGRRATARSRRSSPRHPEARRLLALAYCTLGERDKAVADLSRSGSPRSPDDPVARHMLAAVLRAATCRRARPTPTSRRSFDELCGELRVEARAAGVPRAGARGGALVADAGRAAGKALDVLDAGCGTGLCGPLLAPYARRLAGVDLSGGMLAQAAREGRLRRAGARAS